MKHLAKLVASLLACTAAPVLAQSASSGAQAFRALYKELIETNTVHQVGSCTSAAHLVADHLKASGFSDENITLFSVPEHPEEGGIVAVLPGTDKDANAILLLAHLDVVEAKREDWLRDPFTLIEEDGYFYGRGVVDDKSHAAIFTDALVRLKAEAPRPRTVKMALTCGEETSGAFNGAQYLAEQHRELIDAEFALNEGGGGRLSKDGKHEFITVQSGEKSYADFILETTAPGGHSSVPAGTNPIHDVAKALDSIGNYRFPTRLNPVTAEFLRKTAAGYPDDQARMMRRLADNPEDIKASRALASDPWIEAMTRTTCVATLVEAGHAKNALPQRARANVNCRIIPGETVESTKATLEKLTNNPAIKITAEPREKPLAPQPELSRNVIGPVRQVAEQHFPGVPLVPAMLTGATDGPYLSAVGIPTYGVPGLFFDADGNGVHGLDERISVKSLMDGRAFLYDLIKAYADKK